MYFAAPAPVPAYAGTPATVSLTGEYVRIGGTVPVTVTDAGVSTTATHTAEAMGKFAYFLPVGSTGDNFVFQTANALLTDKNGDGVVSELDLSISITDAIPISIVPSNGAFTLRLTQNVTSPIPFTVTYSAEKIDQLTVKVTSSSVVEEGGGTVFGCNLPLGNSNMVGGEYALLGVGLLGLGLRRPAGALRDLLWPAGMGPSPGTWTSPANAPVTARMPDRVHRPKSSRGR